MKLFLLTFFIGFAAAGKLSGSYLPPSSAQSSGGHGGFLQGPSHTNPSFGGSHGIPANTFGSHGTLGSGAFGGGISHGNSAASFSGYHGSSNIGSQHSGHTGHTTGGYTGQIHGSGGYTGQYQHRAPSGPPIPILKYENVNNGDGSYHFEYATANGITQQEQGHLNNPGTEHAEQVVQGSYSYTGDDGHTYTVHYKADANGFQATGDHLPTPPPIPKAIQESLAYNAAHAGSLDSGAYGGQYSSGQYTSGQYSGGGGGSYGGSHSNQAVSQQYLPPSRPSFGSGSNSGSGYHY